MGCFVILRAQDSNPRGSAEKEKLPGASFLRRAVKSGTDGVSRGSTSHKYAKQTVESLSVHQTIKHFVQMSRVAKDSYVL